MQRHTPRWTLAALGLLTLTALLLASCGTSRAPATARYQAASDKTVYRARDINLGTMFRTGGLSRDPSVALRSWATCSGEDCKPQRAWLSFVLRGSGRTNIVANRDVKITTDTNTHTWPEERQRQTSAFDITREKSTSEVTRIRMTLKTFRDIANSQQRVSGTLGNEDFTLSYEDRAPLRALLKEINSAGQNPPAS